MNHQEAIKPVFGFLIGTTAWISDILQFGTILIGLCGAVVAFASAIYMFRANRLNYKMKSDEWFRRTEIYRDEIDDEDG